MSKKLLLLTYFLIMGLLSFAQTKVVNGKVIDETGNPIPGVTVMQKGSKKGTQTDKDGNFSITISEKSKELVFSSETSSNGRQLAEATRLLDL